MKTRIQQLAELQKIVEDTKTSGDILSLGLQIAIKAYNLGWKDVYDNVEIGYDRGGITFIDTDNIPNLIE